MADTMEVPGEVHPVMAAAAAAAVSGSLNVTVGKFTLAVGIPTGDNAPYTFVLTETGGATSTQLANFSFTDADHFSVKVQMPTFGTGESAVSAGFTLQEGGS